MFLQNKEYIQLFRGNEKLMTAGLCKLVIWDQKIKIDYYMDHLPLTDQTQGTCHLIYLVRKEGEKSLLQRESNFQFVFLKSKFHYAFQIHETADHKIVKIENCYIELAEKYRIYMHGYHLKVQAGEQTAQQMRTEKQTEQQIPVAEEVEDVEQQTRERVEQPDGTEQQKEEQYGEITEETLSNVSGEEIYASEKLPAEENPDKAAYPVRRIDDLKELLSMGENFIELYYNSFLLHSFYQYRHLLLGEDYLAVPGYFYEREAIAAKMMGFPYFIEAAKVDLCSMSGEKRMEKPAEGTYGYFIRATVS